MARGASGGAPPRDSVELHDAVRTRRDDGGPGGSPARAARLAGRERRVSLLYPARLPPRPQRARRSAGPQRHGDDRLRRPEEHRRGTPAARQHPAREDPLAHGDAVHLAGGARLRVRRPRGNGCVRAGLPRGRGGDPDVALIRPDHRARARGGEGARGARLAVPDGAHVRGLGPRTRERSARGTRRPVLQDRAPACRGCAGAGAGPGAPRPLERGSGARMRLGRIAYINCFPVYRAIDRGAVTVPAELVTGTPAELNELLVAGELDVSVISAVEYARHAKELVLLPDLAISCDGPVRSVALLSRRTLGQLDGRTVLLSASSRTSVALLELLCRDVWKIRPHFVEARAEATDLDHLSELPHDAVLVIGDPALLLAARQTYPVK